MVGKKRILPTNSYTFSFGPTFHIIEDIRIADIGFLCKFITSALNEIFKTTRYDCKPNKDESKKEYGIVFVDFPGRVIQSSYKAIHFLSNEDTIPWPKIKDLDAIVDNWTALDDINEENGRNEKNPVIFKCQKPFMLHPKKEKYIQTHLKAIYGASCWTMQEIHVVCIAFGKLGFNIAANKYYPKANALILTEGFLGLPKEEQEEKNTDETNDENETNETNNEDHESEDQDDPIPPSEAAPQENTSLSKIKKIFEETKHKHQKNN